MKKLLSMSLVASATILTLNAGATDLTEAIKGVDVSGTVAYRYNDYQGQTNAIAKAENNYKIALNVKSPVNDDITANTRFIVGSGSNGEPVTLNTTTSADANASVQLSEANFTYSGLANTTVTVGKMGLATPFTVARDAMGNEQTGTGILAASTLGPVTLVGGYFNQTNLSTSGDATAAIPTAQIGADVYVVGAVASVAGVNIDAFYADLADVLDAYTLGLSGSFKAGDVELSPYARYSSLEVDTATTNHSLWKVGMSAQMGIFGAAIGYGETDKDGGIVGFDGSSDTGYDEHWRVTLSGVTNADVLYASANVQATDTLNVAIKYSDMDVKAAADESEIYTQITYQMSSNFSTYLRLGQYDVTGSEKEDMGRLHVQYSF